MIESERDFYTMGGVSINIAPRGPRIGPCWYHAEERSGRTIAWQVVRSLCVAPDAVVLQMEANEMFSAYRSQDAPHSK